MLHIGEAIVFVIILALTLYGFFGPLYLRYRLVRLGKSGRHYESPWARFAEARVLYCISIPSRECLASLVSPILLIQCTGPIAELAGKEVGVPCFSFSPIPSCSTEDIRSVDRFHRVLNFHTQSQDHIRGLGENRFHSRKKRQSS